MFITVEFSLFDNFTIRMLGSYGKSTRNQNFTKMIGTTPNHLNFTIASERFRYFYSARA